MKYVIISIIVVCGLSFCAPEAEATLITIEIEAVVDSVEDLGDGAGYLEGNIEVGDIITGSYTYESTMPDSDPSSPSIGRYEHHTPPCGIFLSVGGFEFRTDPANVDFLVEVANNHPWFDPDINRDNYLLRSYNNLPLYNGVPINHIMWQLDDYSGNAISSDTLPVTAPVLEDWPDSFTGLRITGGDIKDSLSNQNFSVPLLTFLFLHKQSFKFQVLIQKMLSSS